MTIYNSVQKTAPYAPISGVGIDGRQVHVARGEYTVGTATTLTTADVINMVDLPQNARIVGATLKSDLADSSNTLRLNVGISGSATLFFSASTVGSVATSYTSAVNAGAIDYVTTARKTTVQIVPSANATGAPAAAAKMVLLISYVVENPA